MTTWWAVPGVAAIVVILAVSIGFRWLVALQRRVSDHGERLARLEGRQER